MKNLTAANARSFDLGHRSWLTVDETFLSADIADRLLHECLGQKFPWQHQRMRGVLTRRANAWFADDAELIYRYSGQCWIPSPFPSSLTELRQALINTYDCSFNAMLGAYYPDGKAGVAWHDDNDFPQWPDSPIAVISLGAERKFMVRCKSDHATIGNYLTPHGSLIVMGGETQRHFEHAIAKTSKSVGPRVSLSFRVFHAAF